MRRILQTRYFYTTACYLCIILYLISDFSKKFLKLKVNTFSLRNFSKDALICILKARIIESKPELFFYETKNILGENVKFDISLIPMILRDYSHKN